ncbi:hypothetical protein [Sinomicrobium weinanense]|uniref:Uncharacterized protein n=1 Tax=Sinomicrobium weinanense TaxID=2842200 RepID=A0A926Q3X5_9FLAO|nr:hypothetical protein [Sinomicrobium weinanense]MBC9796240.1 hypothetical protein [Sinomicrobium weinanense]MBU3122305.1 hypothetical protein [Sinomicrobium weinanense]
MSIILSIWTFYKKLILPLASIAILTGILGLSATGSFSFKWSGLAYFLLTPLFHYFIYEVRNKNEYYFYFNLGLNKPVLWASTISISLFIALILSLI